MWLKRNGTDFLFVRTEANKQMSHDWTQTSKEIVQKIMSKNNHYNPLLNNHLKLFTIGGRGFSIWIVVCKNDVDKTKQMAWGNVSWDLQNLAECLRTHTCQLTVYRTGDWKTDDVPIWYQWLCETNSLERRFIDCPIPYGFHVSSSSWVPSRTAWKFLPSALRKHTLMNKLVSGGS